MMAETASHVPRLKRVIIAVLTHVLCLSCRYELARVTGASFAQKELVVSSIHVSPFARWVPWAAAMVTRMLAWPCS